MDELVGPVARHGPVEEEDHRNVLVEGGPLFGRVHVHGIHHLVGVGVGVRVRLGVKLRVKLRVKVRARVRQDGAGTSYD